MLSAAERLIPGLAEYMGSSSEENSDPEKDKFILLSKDQIDRPSRSRHPHEYHIYKVDQIGNIHKTQCNAFDMDGVPADWYGKVKEALGTRRDAAEIGRELCGTCVATLYKNMPPSE